MGPLAYRYMSPCDEGSASFPTCEYMAVTQTISVQANSDGSGGQTGIRYYTFAGNPATPAPPTVAFQGTFQDTSGKDIYYFVSSNAIDESANVGYTFTGSNNQTGQSEVFPQPYMARISNLGVADTPTNTVVAGGNDETGSNQYWEGATTVAIDPQDSLTFWGVGEWLPSNQGNSTLNWNTQVFLCRAGRTGSQAFCQ